MLYASENLNRNKHKYLDGERYMNPLIKLGATILGVIIKIANKDDSVGNVVDGVFQISEVVEQEFFLRRNLDRTAQDISDNIAKSCDQILKHHQISEERANVFYNNLVDVVNEAELTYELIIVQKANVDAMYQKLLSIATQYKKDFDPDEYDLFLRLIHHIAGVIVNLVLESPRFVNHGVKHIASTIEELQHKTNEVLSRLEEIDRAVSRKTEDFQRYERHYRNNVIEKYGWIQLLGAKSLDREEKRYKLSIAYVALEMRKGNNPNGNLDIENLFSKSKLLWIDGDAGSGKSTFMQWLAVNSASNTSDILPDLKDSIPFLIELRKQDARSISIKAAVESIMSDNDSIMPENWITQSLESGSAIVLVDGFDEVKADHRDDVLNWIDDFSARYSKTRIIVTSRPQIGKNISKKFTRYRLLPMNRDRVNQFLTYWHKAVLVDKLQVEEEEANRFKKKLSLQIDNSESIRRMVTNPLLCAMICALHYKNGAIMSTERNELYDDCCKMLFGNRDSEKDVQVFAHINLSYEEKKNILSQLAYWMMKNNLIVAKTEQVITRIGHALSGLRQSSQQYHPEELYHYFLERSGILRSPEEGCVDFIHKSFQEYLAAYEIHNQDDWGFIASKYSDINWYETLILSMGFSSINDSELVIERILGNSNNEKNIVIAAACAANAPRLSSKLRHTIDSKIADILPPKSIESSERLSRAGEFVVPYLRHTESLSSDERYFSLNTLRMISSSQALAVAGSYLNKGADERELNLLGNMLEEYTKKEIQSANFENIICDYLESIVANETQYLPEVFFRVFWSTSRETIQKSVSMFSNVTIVNYQNRISRKIMALFSNVKTLKLIGHYESISAISDISSQLEGLELCDYSKKFDFYELNQYSFDSLTRLHFFSNRSLYINGCDCESIKNIADLGLYLYEPMSEVLFSGFGIFSKLNSLTLFHEDIAEFSYFDLSYHTQLKRLLIKVPSYISNSIISMIKSQTISIPSVSIQYDDDPYAFCDSV